MQRSTSARLGGGQRRFAQDCKQCVRGGWLLDVFQWINTTWPHADHRMVNNGEPASTIQTYATCLGSKVEPNADLIIVEPISTGGPSCRGRNGCADAWKATFEATLRGVLMLPRSPAVVLLNVFNFCIHDPELCSKGNLTARGTNESAWSYASLLPAYHLSFDGDARDVAAYYGLPVVSTRGLFFHPAASGRVYPRDLVRDRTGVHPTDASSRTLSAALVHVLELARYASARPSAMVHTRQSSSSSSRGLASAPTQPPSGEDSLIALPPPAWLTNAPGWVQTSAYSASHEQVPRRASQFCFNWDSDKVLLPLQSEGDGWSVEEEYHGKLKPGLRTRREGAEARIALPVGERAGRDEVNGTLAVRYLSTFHSDEVGAALLSCAPPCACEARKVDAYSASFQASIDLVVRVPFASSVRRCDLRVRALPPAESAGGGVGFKLTAVDVTVVD